MRVASNMLSWLLVLDTRDDHFGFLDKDLAIVQVVLDGSTPPRYKERQPNSLQCLKENCLKSTSIAHFRSTNTIRGVHSVPPRVVWKDGKRCAWAIFEDAEKGWREIIHEFVHKVFEKLRLQRGIE